MYHTPTSKGWQALTLAALLALTPTSCVNHINEEIQMGTIPITFSVKVVQSNTKITDNNFESGDEAGLFAMLSPPASDPEPAVFYSPSIAARGDALSPAELAIDSDSWRSGAAACALMDLLTA